MYIQSSIFLLSLLAVTTTTITAAPAPSPLRLPLRKIANTKTNAHFNKRDDFLNAIDHNQPLLNSTTGTGSAPLLNDIDLYQFGVEVKVGTPGQEFLLLFDTGSSDTWIPSKKCTKSKGCLSGRRYDPTVSSTYQGEKDAVDIKYGIGSATGHYFVDRLQVGDLLSLPSQTLVKMDDNKGPIAQQSTHHKDDDDDNDDNLIDGIFGAGFPQGTMMAQQQHGDDDDDKKKKKGRKYSPFAMNLWENKIIPAPLFSITMGTGSTTASDSEWIGQVTFGAVDDTKRKDVIQYTPVLERDDGGYSHWMAGVKGFQFDNGTMTNFKFTEPTHFLIDTGSNFMYLPKGLADQLAHELSKGTAKWDGTTYTVDCDMMKHKKHNEAVLNVMFPPEEKHGKSFPIGLPVSRLVGKNGPDQCIFFFVPSQTSNVFTLGNLWLRNFVSVFDFGKHRLGFSPLVDENDA
ncbi:hypothetical protein [Absidia glauca]|uniref:Peptidase A1 domain-containing protein n=1 Tax=Absidia glauca TaxID=4829 RepID=A0A168MN26_ABSGL|nr:hypothetical protein [Absidia glauca]